MTTTDVWPEELFGDHWRSGPIALVARDGSRQHLEPRRWHEVVSRPDRLVLARVTGPVLDVGCGPGRHVGELARRGHDVLGIDTSSTAVRTAARRGANVLRVSVFGAVPRAAEWGTILLLDGNVGIGGDPVGLLRRCGALLRRDGRVLVETESPESVSRRGPVRVELPNPDGSLDTGRGPAWFPWAVVSSSHIPELAGAAGLGVAERWSVGGRWFAELIRPGGGAPDPFSPPGRP